MDKLKSFLMKIAYCIVIVSLIEPTYLSRTLLHNILGLVRYVAFFAAIPMTFYYQIYKEKAFVLLSLLLIWIGVASVAYNGALSDNYLYNTRLMFSILVFSSVAAKKMPRFYIASFAGIYSLWIFLQGVMWKSGGLFVNSNGQINFFLGTKTTMTYYFVPGILFVLVYMEIAKRNKPTYSRLFFLMLAGGAFLYLTRQPISTAILCTVLMAIGIYVLEKYPVVGEKIMKYGFLATFILCVLFIYNIVQEMFSFIIVDMLNESIELNGRTQIWEQVMNYIYKRPLIGYGYSSGIRFDVWQEYNTSTHNFYLFLFFSSGLVGLGLFFGAIYSIHKKVLKKINFRIVRYILLTLIVINIECITEVCCFNAMYFSVLALSSNVEYILPKKERLKANFDMDLNLME